MDYRAPRLSVNDFSSLSSFSFPPLPRPTFSPFLSSFVVFFLRSFTSARGFRADDDEPRGFLFGVDGAKSSSN